MPERFVVDHNLSPMGLKPFARYEIPYEILEQILGPPQGESLEWVLRDTVTGHVWRLHSSIKVPKGVSREDMLLVAFKWTLSGHKDNKLKDVQVWLADRLLHTKTRSNVEASNENADFTEEMLAEMERDGAEFTAKARRDHFEKVTHRLQRLERLLALPEQVESLIEMQRRLLVIALLEIEVSDIPKAIRAFAEAKNDH